MSAPTSRAWRFIVAVAVVANIAFNYLYERLGLPSNAVVSRRYDNLFTPAGYAFAIWGVIYLAFVVVAVQGLRRAHRDDRAFDRLAPLLALANVLLSVWIVIFASDWIWASVVVIVATLIVAIAMFLIAGDEVARGRSPWLRAPFSLFLGWLSVATIADVAAALTSSGWDGGVQSPSAWAVTMLVVAAALGASIALRYRAPVVALVLAWATYAIHVKVRAIDADVSAIAIGAAGVSAVAAVIAAIMLVGGGRRRAPASEP